MAKLRVYPAAPRRPQRVSARRRGGTLVRTPWAPDATGEPAIRLEQRPWLPQWCETGPRRWLMGWYDPIFECDWMMPCDHEVD